MNSRKVHVFLASAGLAVAAVVPAYAYTGSATVSCDIANTDNLVTVYASGAVTYKQISTSPATNRNNWAVSSNGNSLTKKATNDGQSVSWSGVLASNYTFKTKVVSNTNCNGILPGNGNTALTYSVSG